MKKLIVLLIFVASCTVTANQPKRPIVIVGKRIIDKNFAQYKYISSDGGWYYFEDSINLYHVGDTIK